MQHLELKTTTDAPKWMSSELKEAWVTGVNKAIVIQNQVSDDLELERSEEEI